MTPHETIRSILETLPDSFVLNEPTLSPVVGPDQFGLMFYVDTLRPVTTAFGKVFRDHHWVVSVVSPLTTLEAAGPDLLNATNEVITALEEHSDTVRWSEATLDPLGDRYWAYNIALEMYGENEQEEAPEPAPDQEEG